MTSPRFLTQLPEDTRRVLQTTMLILASCDADLFSHSERVAESLLALAPNGVEEAWYWTGLLHDIGKLALGYEIFRKRGTLTLGERQLMQGHPTKGAALLRDLGAPEIVVQGAEFHHEWWNGRGYPYGISGRDIPLVGRFVAVADAYAAMTSDRPYRRAWKPSRARTDIESNAGRQFDREVVARFFENACSESTTANIQNEVQRVNT